MELTEDVSVLKNVGTQRLSQLHAMGIETVGDLLEHFPREYEDRRQMKTVDELVPGQSNTFRATVLAEAENIRYQKKVQTRLKVGDADNSVTCIWFGMPYLKNTFQVGQTYVFTGRYEIKYGRRQVSSPEFESMEKETLESSGKIIPIYPTTKGMSQKILRKLMAQAVEGMKDRLKDGLPQWVRKQYQLAERNFAIENIHFPQDENSFFLARRRLVFEELYLLQTALFRLKEQVTEGKSGPLLDAKKGRAEIEAALPFSLTDAQKTVLEEIEADFGSGRVMNRLVQGDVGSGKTAVAAVACYETIANGYQAALMAPTEVLAGQHYETFSQLFTPLGVRVGFLRGAMKKKEKQALLDDIATGRVQMVIGTHAVIQDGVLFDRLGFVVTDEQHRFGVKQRVRLAQKGESPHVLVMTATPIPRTLALILYGDLDISIIDALPAGRQAIDTLVVPPSYHERVYGFIEKELKAGRQAYLVCPAVEESEKRETEAVLTYGEKMAQRFSAFRVGILHGKMKADEKQEMMAAFAKNEIQVLVATTVIEVGINVPNATIMVVENAEYFGLSQLHQLRGRVGRGSEKSYCILISEAKNAVTKERLKVMKRTTDGFEIAETDLKLRGPGEFFGTRQHGLPVMKIANLYQDMDVLRLAQQAAKESKNHPLPQEEEEAFLAQLRHFFGGNEIGI